MVLERLVFHSALPCGRAKQIVPALFSKILWGACENHLLMGPCDFGYYLDLLCDPEAATSLSQHGQYGIGCWIFGGSDVSNAATNRLRQRGQRQASGKGRETVPTSDSRGDS